MVSAPHHALWMSGSRNEMRHKSWRIRVRTCFCSSGTVVLLLTMPCGWRADETKLCGQVGESVPFFVRLCCAAVLLCCYSHGGLGWLHVACDDTRCCAGVIHLVVMRACGRITAFKTLLWAEYAQVRATSHIPLAASSFATLHPLIVWSILSQPSTLCFPQTIFHRSRPLCLCPSVYLLQVLSPTLTQRATPAWSCAPVSPGTLPPPRWLPSCPASTWTCRTWPCTRRARSAWRPQTSTTVVRCVPCN